MCQLKKHYWAQAVRGAQGGETAICGQDCLDPTAERVEHPLHYSSGPVPPSEITLMLAVLCLWILVTSLGDPLMLPAINKTMRTNATLWGKCDVLQNTLSALNCCLCPSSLGLLLYALHPHICLPIPWMCSGFDHLTARLYEVYDSKAASAARELEADMQSIYSVAIHNKIKSSL